MTEAPSFSALLRSTISTTLCSTNGDAWTLSSLLDGSTVDILSAFFSYRSSEHCCHWGCCVCSTCRIVSRLWLQPAPCKKPPTNRVGSRLPRGECVWVDLETQADHITHEPWQHCVRVNNSSPLSVGSSTGQRLERSSLTYACCRDPGGITECCYHQNTVGYSMFPLLESWVSVCCVSVCMCMSVCIAICLMPYWKLYTWMPVSIS